MATTMSDPRELFVHELGDVLYAEKLLVKALPELAKEASDSKLTEAFEHHLDETKTQVENLEKVFEALGEPAKAEQCPGIEGIKKEHDEFMSKHDASAELVDLFLTGAGSRTEHYEIAAYTGLIEQARALGEDKAVSLLEQNLEQERSALKTLERCAKELTKATAAA